MGCTMRGHGNGDGVLDWGAVSSSPPSPGHPLGPGSTQELLGCIQAWGQCEAVGLGASYSWDKHRAPAALDGPTRLAKEEATSALVLRHAGCCVQGQRYSSGSTALKNHGDY